MNQNAKDKAFDYAIIIILLVFGLLILLPLLYVIFSSFATKQEINTRGFFIFPNVWTLDSYRFLFSHNGFVTAYKNAVIITVVGTAINIVLTSLMAYGLSKRWLIGRSTISFMVVFTMLFSGGMIPTYLVVYSLGLINSYWSIWLVNAILSFNLIVMRSFFQNIPVELEESARIDGSGEWRLLVQIILPLSMPAIATFTLFYLVFQWNTYFTAILYLNDTRMYPLQVFLRQILVGADILMQTTGTESEYEYSPAVRNASIFLTALPLLIIYPFMQKHFNKGMLLGSVKG
ncbi:carbohydrate ABC transporter permease [Paenibacillus sp. 1P07SE]|uniref:carbohydrate ABC transporter permease n=1 Tax=Paenibacillus sp. 1P07SE TaxID=3132209 RepID=UPI0039A4D681